MYNIVILSFVGVPVSLILDDVNANYIIISLFIYFAATVTLCLVFIPKVITIWASKGTSFVSYIYIYIFDKLILIFSANSANACFFIIL